HSTLTVNHQCSQQNERRKHDIQAPEQDRMNHRQHRVDCTAFKSNQLDIHHLHTLGGLLRPAECTRYIKQSDNREHDGIERPSQREGDNAQNEDHDCHWNAEQKDDQIVDEESHDTACTYAFKKCAAFVTRPHYFAVQNMVGHCPFQSLKREASGKINPS